MRSSPRVPPPLRTTSTPRRTQSHAAASPRTQQLQQQSASISASMLPPIPSALPATSATQQHGSSTSASSANITPAAAPVFYMPKKKLNDAAMAALSATAAELHKVCVFDLANGGEVVIKNKQDTDRARLVAQLYKSYVHNDTMKRQFTQVVGSMDLARKKELAMESLERFHQNQQRAMMARKVMPESISRHRANILKHLEIDRCFGDLSKDTSELSSVRIASAAVDSLLYHEAQKVADAQLNQRKSLILPDNARPVDVLEMRLDAFRRQHVPFGPRKLVQ